MSRKHPLLKNEIEMINLILSRKVFPTLPYRLKLYNRLNELKKLWYKDGSHKKNNIEHKEVKT